MAHEGMPTAFDVLVLGSGPAGEKAAFQAAKLHRRVAVVDRGDCVGGNCLHTATIPSKTLRETILYIAGVRQRSLYGIQTKLGKHVTVEDLLRRKDSVIRSQVEVLEHKFDRNDVTLLRGAARFVDAHRVEVVGAAGSRQEVSADLVVIATGSRPARDPSIPFDDEHVYDSDAILRLNAVPHTLAIVGGGVIGCEYACMFAVLGTRVTLIDTRPRVLDFADREIAELMVARMREHGVTLRLGEEVAEVRLEQPGRVVAATRSGKAVVAEKLLYAVGREGNTADLGLEHAGLTPGRRGLLAVNEHYQTAVPHIYAVGDVIGFPSLAATAMHQGRLAMAHALGLAVNGADAHVPYGIFTIPEISMVGETEEQLTAACVPYEVGQAFFREIARGEIVGDRAGMLKLLFERDTHRLRGVHIIGEKASELIHIGQAVLAFGGPIDYFVENVFNHPTLSEAYKVAALNGLNRL
jgi:NAD(P) transhydrogenase